MPDKKDRGKHSSTHSIRICRGNIRPSSHMSCTRRRSRALSIWRSPRSSRKHASEELRHALTISKHIDYLGGMPAATANPMKLSEKATDMLRATRQRKRDRAQLS